MKLGLPVEILGTGASVPDTVVTNDDLAKRVETNNEWIVKRTGIRERRIAAPEVATLDLALAASRAALAEAQLAPEDIDLIQVASVTPDHILPAMACELQAALGCRTVPAFDLLAACSGFVFGLVNAAQYVTHGLVRNALVVGAETLSRITDAEDRGTCVLFGDGAGAAVIRRSSDPQRALLSGELGADGTKAKYIWVPAGGSREPASQRTINERLHFMKMEGREVYKFAVTKLQDMIRRAVDDAGVALSDVKLFIPHQSNARIIESAADKLEIPPERMFMNIDRFGNTSAASIPMALHEARQSGRATRGDLVMLLGVGAGLTWGSILLRL
jgi:3-oxoacyl-[acyl-carrier-protein] synthase-3